MAKIAFLGHNDPERGPLVQGIGAEMNEVS
jgi:hypothetical protein